MGGAGPCRLHFGTRIFLFASFQIVLNSIYAYLPSPLPQRKKRKEKKRKEKRTYVLLALPTKGTESLSAPVKWIQHEAGKFKSSYIECFYHGGRTGRRTSVDFVGPPMFEVTNGGGGGIASLYGVEIKAWWRSCKRSFVGLSVYTSRYYWA